MAEINLLQNTNNENTERRNQNLLNSSGIGLLVLLIVIYGLFFVLAAKAESDSKALVTEQSATQQEVATGQQYKQLINAQSKLKSVQGLLKVHTYWCEVLPNFNSDTLKTAKYSKFSANSDGSATITGSVPDFQNLAKLIQAYKIKDDKFVKDVKLVNVGLSSGVKNDITYTINVSFNKDVLAQYVDRCN
jgi:hypothetical protein